MRKKQSLHATMAKRQNRKGCSMTTPTRMFTPVAPHRRRAGCQGALSSRLSKSKLLAEGYNVCLQPSTSRSMINLPVMNSTFTCDISFAGTSPYQRQQKRGRLGDRNYLGCAKGLHNSMRRSSVGPLAQQCCVSSRARHRHQSHALPVVWPALTAVSVFSSTRSVWR